MMIYVAASAAVAAWVCSVAAKHQPEAKELFEEAADVGEPDAQYNLAILYANMPVENVQPTWLPVL